MLFIDVKLLSFFLSCILFLFFAYFLNADMEVNIAAVRYKFKHN